MTEKLPPTSFIVGMAFLYGVAAAAVVIAGLGMVTVVTETDNAFAPLVQGAGVVALIVALASLIGALAVIGLRRDNRVRGVRIAAITAGVLIVYLLAYAITIVAVSHDDGFVVALTAVFVFASPATLVVVVATAAATWAYFGTLGWQARNADTRQYLGADD